MKKIYGIIFIGLVASFLFVTVCSSFIKKFEGLNSDQEMRISKALVLAGDNKYEILKAYKNLPDELRDDFLFIIENMPERDLTTLSGDFISEDIILSDSIFKTRAWADKIPKAIYQNYVLPYVNVNEKREAWRMKLHKLFKHIVDTCETPGEATVALNNTIWDLVNVHYNTKRPKADQCPSESMKANMASCTGLSILLIDACRSVGVPARFVGTPLWVDVDGNHSWVEIWDQGWHFIGAWEPGPLDETWFEERAAKATPDNPKYGIFAVSYKKTNGIFPTVWDTVQDYVCAENITERYLTTDDGDLFSTLAVRVFENDTRVVSKVRVYDGKKLVEKGMSYGEDHDLNDMLSFKLDKETAYSIVINCGDVEKTIDVNTENKKFKKLDIRL